MKLNTLSTELDDFWDEQNQKLLAHPDFLCDQGNLFDNILNFKNSKSTLRLDFSVLDLPHIILEQPASLNIKGSLYSLSLKEYAKLFFINALSQGSSQAAYPIYQMLVHVCAFLNSQKLIELTTHNIESFHISFLTQSVNNDGFFNRLSSPSYKGTYNNTNLINVRNKLQSLGISGVIGCKLNQNLYYSALGNVCPSIINISLNEYRRGGSYDFLSLEMGQYYVDYLRQVYENDFLYSLICRKSIDAVSVRFAIDKPEYRKSNTYWNKVILETIQGNFIPNKHEKISKIRTRGKLHDVLAIELLKQYRMQKEKILSLNEGCIHELVLDLGLEMRFDAVEVIRILMLQKHYPFSAHKTSEQVWSNYLSSLDKTFINSHDLAKISTYDVYKKMERIILKRNLNKETFMVSLSRWAVRIMGDKLGTSLTSLTVEMERITHAMTTLVVSWLGYRASEFGFPYSAIHADYNLDILDNSHVPFRFKLKWVVPKTNGSTKINREITSQCYQIASHLNDYFQPKEGEPCLYESTGGNKKRSPSNESETAIEHRIKINWSSFSKYYQPFEDVVELDRLSKSLEYELSDRDKIKFKSLRSKYDLGSASGQHLLNTCNEVRHDLVKLNCCAFAGGRTQAKFKATLIELNKTGDITNSEHKEVIEQYLSTETKEWLMSENLTLDQKAMMDISDEIKQGVRYPSAHAFRHIWAEAVLTRYQGDVGAVIRHQFCHLDESFFMAYLCGKEPMLLMKAARLKVLNSIVDTLLIDANKIGQDYIGGFSRYVHKAKQLTKAVTPSEIRLLKENIMGRIISIKPSHFATCVPREGSEHRAKCAEFGDINPQNARPEFCLNCTHAIITTGNLKGIWLTIQPFVIEALNKDVMGFMVEQHLPILRSGYKRIKEFKTSRNTESIFKILKVLDKAIISIENKLKEEEGLYGH